MANDDENKISNDNSVKKQRDKIDSKLSHNSDKKEGQGDDTNEYVEQYFNGEIIRVPKDTYGIFRVAETVEEAEKYGDFVPAGIPSQHSIRAETSESQDEINDSSEEENIDISKLFPNVQRGTGIVIVPGAVYEYRGNEPQQQTHVANESTVSKGKQIEKPAQASEVNNLIQQERERLNKMKFAKVTQDVGHSMKVEAEPEELGNVEVAADDDEIFIVDVSQAQIKDFAKKPPEDTIKNEKHVESLADDKKAGQNYLNAAEFVPKTNEQIDAEILKFMIQKVSKFLAEKLLDDNINSNKITDINSFKYAVARQVADSQSSIVSLFNDFESKETKRDVVNKIDSFLNSNDLIKRVEGQAVVDLNTLVENETKIIVNTYKRMRELGDNLSVDEQKILAAWSKCKNTTNFVNFYANTVVLKSEAAKKEYKKVENTEIQPLINIKEVEKGKLIEYCNALKNRTIQIAKVASGNIVLIETIKEKGQNRFVVLPENRYIQRYEIGDKKGTKCFKILKCVAKGENDAKIVEDKIYSEQDLIQELSKESKENKDFIINEMLGQNYVEKAIKERGGYVGYNYFEQFGEQHIYVNPNTRKRFQDEQKNKLTNDVSKGQE